MIQKSFAVTMGIIMGIIILIGLTTLPVHSQTAGHSSSSGSSSTAVKESDHSKQDSLNKALLSAAGENNLDQVNEILSKGADINAVDDEKGATALIWASAKGHRDIVARLLERKANIWAKTKAGLTARDAAEAGNHLDIVNLLDIARMVDRRSGQSVEQLLVQGAKVNDIDKVSDCLADAANPNCKASDGVTPLEFAAYNGNVSMITILLNKGADPNGADKDGDTPLHVASKYGRKDAALFLIQKGGDVNAKNKAGHTPLSIAKSKGFKELADALKEKGGTGSIIRKKMSRGSQPNKSNDPLDGVSRYMDAQTRDIRANSGGIARKSTWH